MPKKTPTSHNISRRAFLRSIGGFAAGHRLLTTVPLGAAGLLGWAEHDTRDIKVEKWDLYYPNLPHNLEGKTICQLSDLHLESLHFPPQQIRQLVMTRKPDLLVITGDIISTRTDLDKMNSYLSGFSAPYGKFFVMGNNDYDNLSHTLLKRFLHKLQALEFTTLINDSSFLAKLNLWIIGVDDPATMHDDVAKAYQKVATSAESSPPPFRLVLAHSTDCLDDVAFMGADLLLTGHTHGGQIRLPGLPPLLTNTYLGDHGIYEGYHVINDIPLYINRGLGESIIPLRFNVPPEITFFTLHRGDSQPRHQVN